MLKLGSTTINKIKLGSTTINKVYLGPNQVYPTGVTPPSSTLLESFENNPYTGSSIFTDWSENSTPDVDWVRSSSHVTQGSFSWRYNDTLGSATQLLATFPTGAVNLSSYISLSIDLFIANIDITDFLTFFVFDASFNPVSSSTSPGATGAATLTATFSDNPLFDKSAVYVAVANNGSITAKDYYIDNLRGN